MTSFSIAVCAGTALSLGLFALLAARGSLRRSAAEWFALLALPLGVFGGHLLYSLALIRETLMEFGAAFLVSPWRGGFMFYGTVLGVILAARLASAISRERLTLRLLDCAAPALLLLIAVIRFAEPLDGQGRGIGLDGSEPWGFFPFAMAFNKRYPDELDYAIFMGEGCWAVLCAALTIRGGGRRPVGRTAALALTLYAAGQILLETLRRDVTVRWRFVRVSQLISAIALLLLLLWALRSRHCRTKQAVWRLVGFFACVGIVIGMEFAVDKPLRLPGGGLYYFDLWMVYLIIGLCAVCMGINTWTAVIGRGLGKDPGEERT